MRATKIKNPVVRTFPTFSKSSKFILRVAREKVTTTKKIFMMPW